MNGKRLGKGLPNFGNTCYINSVLQVLRYQKPLVYMLREFETDPHTHDKKEQLLGSFVELLFSDADVRELHLLIRNLSQVSDQFRLLRQCDSHELYLFLVDSFFEKNKHLQNPFKGTLGSTITCQTCGHKSVTKTPFISLSLEMRNSTTPLTVTEMLEDFKTLEVLEDRISCERCNVKQPCTKQLHLEVCPKLLVVHLKRFIGLAKNQDPISIEKEIVVNDKKYRLSSLCNHTGSSRGGHYTATCLRKDSMWVVCNDNNISKIQDLPTVSAVPYIMFYESI